MFLSYLKDELAVIRGAHSELIFNIYNMFQIYDILWFEEMEPK